MVDQAVLVNADQQDAAFFLQHPGRHAHIRNPVADYECRGEFWRLGTHNTDRRRILLWRIPSDNPYYDPRKPGLLKIPFLAFSDETIEDRDDILLPILHSIMTNAKASV